MKANAYRWAEVDCDEPVALLKRWKIAGDQMLLAKVRLEKGCHVALHQHVSEQMSIIVSGRIRWNIGTDGDPFQRTQEMRGGEVMHLPSNVWHGVDALEDTDIIDILSPFGPMGVDSQKG